MKTCLATSIITIVCLLHSIDVSSQKKATPSNRADIPVVGIIKDLSDSALLDLVQRQTFRFFWDGAHSVSGLALERSNTVLAEHYWTSSMKHGVNLISARRNLVLMRAQ